MAQTDTQTDTQTDMATLWPTRPSGAELVKICFQWLRQKDRQLTKEEEDVRQEEKGEKRIYISSPYFQDSAFMVLSYRT